MPEHIRIGDVAPRVQYVGDGVRTAFPFTFPIFDPDDMELRVAGVPLAGGFLVASAGQSAGGYVTLPSPPAPGVTVTLRRRRNTATTWRPRCARIRPRSAAG